MNSMMPRLAMLNSPSKLNGAGIALGAVLSDLSVIDVAGKFGGVLVFLVLGLERADAQPVLLRKNQAADPNVLDDPRPVATVPFHPLIEHLAAERAEVALDRASRRSGGRSRP